MRTTQVKSALKKLGYTFVRDNRHLKCIDPDGNVRILSKKYLERCMDNPRFLRTIQSNRSLYFKNKTPDYIMKGHKI